MVIETKKGSYTLLALRHTKVREGKSICLLRELQEKRCPEGSARFHLMKEGGKCVQGRGEGKG